MMLQEKDHSNFGHNNNGLQPTSVVDDDQGYHDNQDEAFDSSATPSASGMRTRNPPITSSPVAVSFFHRPAWLYGCLFFWLAVTGGRFWALLLQGKFEAILRHSSHDPNNDADDDPSSEQYSSQSSSSLQQHAALIAAWCLAGQSLISTLLTPATAALVDGLERSVGNASGSTDDRTGNTTTTTGNTNNNSSNGTIRPRAAAVCITVATCCILGHYHDDGTDTYIGNSNSGSNNGNNNASNNSSSWASISFHVLLQLLYAASVCTVFPTLDALTLAYLTEDENDGANQDYGNNIKPTDAYGQERLYGAISWAAAHCLLGGLMDYYHHPSSNDNNNNNNSDNSDNTHHSWDFLTSTASPMYALVLLSALVLVGSLEWYARAATQRQRVRQLQRQQQQQDDSAQSYQDDDNQEAALPSNLHEDVEAPVPMQSQRPRIGDSPNPATPMTTSTEQIRNLLYLFCGSSLLTATFAVCLFLLATGQVLVETLVFIYFESLGSSYTLMGLTVLWTVAFEIPIFHKAPALLQQWGGNALLLLACGAYVVRVLGYCAIPHGRAGWVLWLEPLHGVTYACTKMAAVNWAATRSPVGWETTGQGMVSLLQGTGSFLGLVYGGWAEENLGGRGLYLSSSAIVLVGAAVFGMAWYWNMEQQADAQASASYAVLKQSDSEDFRDEPTEEMEVVFDGSKDTGVELVERTSSLSYSHGHPANDDGMPPLQPTIENLAAPTLAADLPGDTPSVDLIDLLTDETPIEKEVPMPPPPPMRSELMYEIHNFKPHNGLLQRLVNDSQGGKTFEESYEQLAALGEGGFATVYQCRHRLNGLTYAVKEIAHDDYELNDGANSLQDEIRIMKALQESRYIVRLYDVFERDRYPRTTHLVMEELTGGDLLDRLTEKQVYSETDARAVAKSLFYAIRYMHNKGFAHRDVKLENVLMVSRDNDVAIKLCDFGCAQDLRLCPNGQMQDMAGSPQYAAPEVYNRTAEQGYGKECDLWSIGVVLYILLCGYEPFPGEVSIYELAELICDGNYEFVEKDWRNVSQAAKDVVSGLITVDVAARWTVEKALDSTWFRS